MGLARDGIFVRRLGTEPHQYATPSGMSCDCTLDISKAYRFTSEEADWYANDHGNDRANAWVWVGTLIPLYDEEE